MRLTDIPSILLEDIATKWRRRLIAAAIIVAFALGIIIQGISAARHALEPQVGPVWARLILVGIFALIIVGTVVVLQRQEKRTAAAAARDRRPGSETRVTMIAEAIDLGYTLARDMTKKAPADPEADAAAAAVDDPPADPAPARRRTRSSPRGAAT